MLYIETESRDAAFHFSAEEYFMRRPPSGEPVMMIWQTDKCVMLGSFQVAGAEIDMKTARDEGIQIVRRSSGGGTIFTDPGTILVTEIRSFSEGQFPQQAAKRMLTKSVVGALHKMGVPAKPEGRNDITVDGKKISGIAQYVRRGRVCSHCSLLYDTDLDMLARVLQADDEKIRSKAVRSVRSRVANMKDCMDDRLSAQDFLSLLKQNLFEKYEVSKTTLSGRELAEIDAIYYEKYANPLWTHGSSPHYTFRSSRRFAGGTVEVFLDIVKGNIVSCSIRGDFLGTVPIRGLEERLENREHQYQALAGALDDTALYPYLGNISKKELLSCIFE